MLNSKYPRKSQDHHQYPLVAKKKKLLYFLDPGKQDVNCFLKPWTRGILNLELPQNPPPYYNFPYPFDSPFLVVAPKLDLTCLPFTIVLRYFPSCLHSTPKPEPHSSLMNPSELLESTTQIFGKLSGEYPYSESRDHTPCLHDQDSHTNSKYLVIVHT